MDVQQTYTETYLAMLETAAELKEMREQLKNMEAALAVEENLNKKWVCNNHTFTVKRDTSKIAPCVEEKKKNVQHLFDSLRQNKEVFASLNGETFAEMVMKEMNSSIRRKDEIVVVHKEGKSET